MKIVPTKPEEPQEPDPMAPLPYQLQMDINIALLDAIVDMKGFNNDTKYEELTPLWQFFLRTRNLAVAISNKMVEEVARLEREKNE